MKIENKKSINESKIDLLYYKTREELNFLKLGYPALIIFNIFFFILCGYDFIVDKKVDTLLMNIELVFIGVIFLIALIVVTPIVIKKVKKYKKYKDLRYYKMFDEIDDFKNIKTFKVIKNLKIEGDYNLFGVNDYHISEIYKKIKNGEIVNVYLEQEKGFMSFGLFFYYDDNKASYIVIDLNCEIDFEEVIEDDEFIFNVNQYKFYKEIKKEKNYE